MSARYRWAVLAAGTFAAATNAASFLGLAVVAPTLRTRYGLSLSGIGFVLGVVNVGALFTLLGFGLLADRIGERAVLSGGLAASAAGLAGAAFSSPLWLLVTMLSLSSTFGASVNAASGRAVMSWFDREERGLALGIRQTAIPIGGAAAALALPPLVAAGGLRSAFLALAGGCAAGALAGAVLMRDRRSDPAAFDARPLRDRNMWRLSGGSALLLVAQVSVISFAVLFLHGDRGFSTRDAGAVLAVINGFGIVARIAAGRWSDRLGARILPLRRLGYALAGAMAVCAALAHAPIAVLVPSLVVAGVFGLSWNGLSFTAAAETAGHARSGAAIGLQQTVLAVGVAVVPVAFGALVDATSWRVGFAVAAVAPLAGALVLRRVPEPASR